MLTPCYVVSLTEGDPARFWDSNLNLPPLSCFFTEGEKMTQDEVEYRLGESAAAGCHGDGWIKQAAGRTKL